MKIETSVQEVFHGFTFRVPSPKGTVFVTVMESDEGKPVGIQIMLGKSGSEAKSWAESLSRTLTLALDMGGGINDIIKELSLNNTDGATVLENGVVIRSHVGAVCYALMQYRKAKYQELREALGGLDDDERLGSLGG